MRKILAAAVVIVGSVFTWAADTPAAGPKPPNPGAHFTFEPRTGDKIWGDGLPYKNGEGGVVGQIYADGSGDATLNLYRTRPRRVFYGAYDGTGQPAGTPNGAFADGWFINIHNVWNMPYDVPVQTEATFTTGVGEFRWCGAGDATPRWCEGFTGSETVTVTRTGNTWHVVANSNTPDPDPDVPRNMPNMLLQSFKGGLRVAGYYDMPFALTIEMQ